MFSNEKQFIGLHARYNKKSELQKMGVITLDVKCQYGGAMPSSESKNITDTTITTAVLIVVFGLLLIGIIVLVLCYKYH